MSNPGSATVSSRKEKGSSQSLGCCSTACSLGKHVDTTASRCSHGVRSVLLPESQPPLVQQLHGALIFAAQKGSADKEDLDDLLSSSAGDTWTFLRLGRDLAGTRHADESPSRLAHRDVTMPAPSIYPPSSFFWAETSIPLPSRSCDASYASVVLESLLEEAHEAAHVSGIPKHHYHRPSYASG
ncbi:hypothetical protein CC78DRAFT_576104 [Lojkania enalia]|uniref:Uncharacterized protein n=1 Tax=Lojkania enalia TaxID=147567 RepID=A0A9P4KGB2_9PLEO|nr:hypothetical protein CC78DRAFT_576104 [Didymosphaeria enalia]